jgi:hypothetical protein
VLGTCTWKYYTLWLLVLVSTWKYCTVWCLVLVPGSTVQYGACYLYLEVLYIMVFGTCKYLEVLYSMVLGTCTWKHCIVRRLVLVPGITVQYDAWYLYLEVLYSNSTWYLYLDVLYWMVPGTYTWKYCIVAYSTCFSILCQKRVCTLSTSSFLNSELGGWENLKAY